MNFPKSRAILIAYAAALALPTVVAAWWMLTPDMPQHSDDGSEQAAASSDTASMDRTPAAIPHTAAVTRSGNGTAQENADADDFQQYAQTLRAQGQPEQTVRELVASRVTAAYQARRTAIRSQARQAGAPVADIEAQLNSLNREQGSVIAQLVGAAQLPPAAQTASTTLAAAQPVQSVVANQILVPAVMADALPATVKTEAQVADLEKLRNDFVNAVGGANQDPADPNYLKRWEQAQAAADQRYRLLFGDNAYVAMQMKAQQAIGVQQPQPSK